MVTNMTGSSILKSTGHTGQVKPVNLSVRFILGDRDPHSEENSESESEDILESEDEWHSCVSQQRRMNVSMLQIALIILRTRLISLFPPGMSSISETNRVGWRRVVGNLQNLIESLTLMKRHT